jgi:hypothetical protein
MSIMVKLLTAAAALLGSTSAAYCQPPAFYTSAFGEHEFVSLFMRDATVAVEPGFDYDVFIEIARGPPDGTGSYTDPSRHKAAVRCYDPGAVMVRGALYDVSGLGEGDWKLALWNSVCKTPTS